MALVHFDGKFCGVVVWFNLLNEMTSIGHRELFALKINIADKTRKLGEKPC